MNQGYLDINEENSWVKLGDKLAGATIDFDLKTTVGDDGFELNEQTGGYSVTLEFKQ